ncbi:Hypp1575 [Branchiostoma lanceolatum]|uniref:Hypp1575 protein n=1 Tax=Branchiostoma lanceolatum TaxID=7740 RepID=A0A8K0EJF8_BRALA|nr:Hypp1575 [Branchiostoma lanceolatum]
MRFKERARVPGKTTDEIYIPFSDEGVEIVGQVLPGRARCPSCQHALQDHRPQTKEEAAAAMSPGPPGRATICRVIGNRLMASDPADRAVSGLHTVALRTG